MAHPQSKPPRAPKPHRHPFRRAVLRGLAVVLPPLLTIVIFLWIGSTIQRYVFEPVTAGVRNVIVLAIREPVPTGHKEPTFEADGQTFHRLAGGGYVPQYVFETLDDDISQPTPATPTQAYRLYVDLKYLRPQFVMPAFIVVFVLLLYLLGKFLAAGMGRVLWTFFERGIDRLPLVRNVYSSVKQVTDFMFTESEIEYTRVVAVQYPRKGIWSLGLVTSESLREIRDAAGEPVLAVLIPSSPMPVTGYTITVLRSESIDLDITIDQAFQFIVSCGVVVPPQQLQQLAAGAIDVDDDREPAQAGVLPHADR